MEKQDIAKMFSMIVMVFVVFSVFRSWENSNKVSFVKDAQLIKVYDVEYASGIMMNETELEAKLLKTIESPSLFFKSITHDDDQLIWDKDYYAIIITGENQKIRARFSDYAYVFEVEDREGHFRFKLSNEDSWIFY